MLPFATKGNGSAGIWDALFTATSALCVTGLAVQDTASYWSGFGQAVILLLIQVGGMGVVTVAAAIALFSGKKISLMQRGTMQEAMAAPQMGGIVRLTGFIVKFTLFFELAGAVMMMPVFCRDYGIKGVWLAVFHSVSAFCNAGFDLLGTKEHPFVSMTGYSGDLLINLVLMSLIIVGGIGFFTWADIKEHGIHIRKYRMQSKVIFATTAALICVPALYFYFAEFRNAGQKEAILCSLFQTVTARTAGFNTADLNVMSGAAKGCMIVLMLIGGAPGSTAGGIKVTTAAVLFANMKAAFMRKNEIHFFGRRIDEKVIRDAATILMLDVSMFVLAAMMISSTEHLPMGWCLFETASAVSTTGLSLGITPMLSHSSELLLTGLMFMGRVGGLTLIYAAVSENGKNLSRLSKEKITVG